MRSRGVILVVVLIVVAALALSAYAFSELMFTHNEVTQVSGRQVQADSLTASGVLTGKITSSDLMVAISATNCRAQVPSPLPFIHCSKTRHRASDRKQTKMGAAARPVL